MSSSRSAGLWGQHESGRGLQLLSENYHLDTCTACSSNDDDKRRMNNYANEHGTVKELLMNTSSLSSTSTMMHSLSTVGCLRNDSASSS
eukprot:2271772-Amphidinium_carterae.1